jgi:hypothetical protein
MSDQAQDFIPGRRTLHSFIRCSTPEQALKTTERRQVEKGRRYAAEQPMCRTAPGY